MATPPAGSVAGPARPPPGSSAPAGGPTAPGGASTGRGRGCPGASGCRRAGGGPPSSSACRSIVSRSSSTGLSRPSGVRGEVGRRASALVGGRRGPGPVPDQPPPGRGPVRAQRGGHPTARRPRGRGPLARGRPPRRTAPARRARRPRGGWPCGAGPPGTRRRAPTTHTGLERHRGPRGAVVPTGVQREDGVVGVRGAHPTIIAHRPSGARARSGGDDAPEAEQGAGLLEEQPRRHPDAVRRPSRGPAVTRVPDPPTTVGARDRASSSTTPAARADDSSVGPPSHSTCRSPALGELPERRREVDVVRPRHDHGIPPRGATGPGPAAGARRPRT